VLQSDMGHPSTRPYRPIRSGRQDGRLRLGRSRQGRSRQDRWPTTGADGVVDDMNRIDQNQAAAWEADAGQRNRQRDEGSVSS